MKKFIYFLVVLIIIGVIGYNYVYKEHRDIEAEKAEYNIESSEIINDFTTDIEAANQKYLNKTIEISGKVTHTNENTLTLNDVIFCYMNDSTNNSIIINNQIIIKGRFIGYDELLEELKIDQASITK